ncbi:putative High affinity cAMP-specific and IBMX-insensitive 3',5'-cyclic phosphodiesterase 8A [Blattamonas nauphoetae]|uniref:High affinity cAMP-specific and IBMX-insensitive 3',5'-cyclic phosphodiesterase 8A n=1 Tax=Blattamonas nauphoetae TaxID=2049346 RepID=A0ABQ9YK19_9EUKA|nr:putative High affinity cAMP-specific and IBMX-insensitive 3',5'-cyclic phosphodiesterase 8A [Blattamonas nauphoetae]
MHTNEPLKGDAFDFPAVKLFSLLKRILEEKSLSTEIRDGIITVLPTLQSGQLYLSRPSRKMSIASTSSAYSALMQQYFNTTSDNDSLHQDLDSFQPQFNDQKPPTADKTPDPDQNHQKREFFLQIPPFQKSNANIPTILTREQHLSTNTTISLPMRRRAPTSAKLPDRQPLYEAEKVYYHSLHNASSTDRTHHSYTERSSRGKSWSPDADILAGRSIHDPPIGDFLRPPRSKTVAGSSHPQPVSPTNLSLTQSSRSSRSLRTGPVSKMGTNLVPLLTHPKNQQSSKRSPQLPPKRRPGRCICHRRCNSYPLSHNFTFCPENDSYPSQPPRYCDLYIPYVPSVRPRKEYALAAPVASSFRNRLQRRSRSHCISRRHHISFFMRTMALSPRSFSDNIWSIPLALRSDPLLSVCFPNELNGLYKIAIPPSVISAPQKTINRAARGIKRQPGTMPLPNRPLLSHLNRQAQTTLLCLVSSFGTLSFDTARIDEVTGGHALTVVGMLVFKRHNLLALFHINELTFIAFCLALEREYTSAPFHNAARAANVLHFCHWTVTQPGGTFSMLGSFDLLCLFVAAMGLDVGHPGLTADFLIARRDPIATRYNDTSPLENHHAALLFGEILNWEKVADAKRNEDINSILVSLTVGQRLELRKRVISLILSTEGKHHFKLQSEILMKVESILAEKNQSSHKSDTHPIPPGSTPSPSNLRLPPNAPSVRSPLVQSAMADSPKEWVGTILHSPLGRDLISRTVLSLADHSHMLYPYSLCSKWAHRLLLERQQQGDQEKKANRPVEGMFDRSTATKHKIAEWQLAFGQTFIQPYTEAGHYLLGCFSECLDNLSANIASWRTISAQQQNQ